MIKNFTFGLIAFAAVFAIGFSMNSTPSAKAGPFYTTLSTATTSTAISVTTSARILATSTSPTGGYFRTYASICNTSANPVYLRMDGDKQENSTSTGGIPIAAAAGYSACYEITDKNSYQGSIQASSTNGTATTLYIQEYVQ